MPASEDQDESALEASERRLSLAQQALGFGVWDWDLRRGRIDWSPEMYDILGLDPKVDAADPYGAWLRVLHPQDRDRQDELARASAARGEGFSRTFRIVRPGRGEVRWVRTDATVVHDAEGRPVRMVGVNLDVTEQQRAAEALRDSQAELRLITDALPELISFIDRSGVYRFANRAYEDWYGQKPAEIVGRDVRAVLGDAAYEVRRPFIDRALSGEDCSLDVEVVRPDGRIRFGEARYLPHRDEAGAVDGFYAYVIDITERKRQEAALQTTAERLRLAAAALNALVANAPVGFAFFDKEHRYTRINTVLAAINGVPAEAHLGRRIEDLLPVNALAVCPVLDRVFATGEPVSAVEVDGETPARPGERRSWLAGFFPVLAADGSVAQVGATVVDITDRKRAEAEVRASEQRFRGVFDSGAVGFSIYDANTGETLAINDRLLAITGHTRADYEEGRWDWREVTPPELLVLDEAATAQARAEGAWTPYEKEYVHKDGRRVPVRLSSAPMPGEPGRVVCVVDDLTEMRAAEARLRENEERLRLATENAEVGFWDVDEVNEVLHWSLRVKAMFGISPDVPVTMRDFYEGLHPDDREKTAAAYAAAADPARRALYDVEYRTIGKEDGVVRWVAAKGRGVFDAQGRCLRVAGTVIEVTPRKLAEERLRDLNETLERRVEAALAERKLLADIVEGTDALVQVVDMDHRWLAINKAAAREFEAIFGARPAVGVSMIDALAHLPDHQAALRSVWSRALAGEQFTEVSEFGEPTGARRFYETKYNTLLDAKGRVIGAYQFSYDVTQRMLEQERLRKTEDALRQAQKMEAVGQLTGGIAHDFNNLLQGVAGSLDLIRRKPGDRERVQRWAEAGLQAAERGAKLTGQLLAFSRVQRLELKPIAVGSLVTGFRDMLSRTIGAHVRVTLALAGDDLRVLGDEVQIEMAVLNLALNARDAMPDGGELTISTRAIQLHRDPELADGPYVELAVSDTGTGMPAEVMARAFDPFFTTKGVGKGTGLGLSQVYGAVRQAGGTVRIDSRLGEGTTVRLFLPQTCTREQQDDARVDGVGQGEISARVLVVDDDPDVRRFMLESLDALGLEVTTAEDGPSGLSELERCDPDVVILDFSMPGMNGADVAKLIRQKRPRLPIIFATGFAESAAIEAAGPPDTPVLRKPFGVGELQATLAEVLGQL